MINVKELKQMIEYDREQLKRMREYERQNHLQSVIIEAAKNGKNFCIIPNLTLPEIKLFKKNGYTVREMISRSENEKFENVLNTYKILWERI